MKRFCLFAIVVAGLFTCAAFAQTPLITVTPANTDGSQPVLVKWNVPGAISCAASGLWSGTKPVAGQSTVTPTKTGVFLLDCVGAVPGGSLSVTWTPANTNTDGTPLTNLAGAKVYYGNSASALSTSVTVNNPGVTSTTLTNLVAGTTYMAVASLTSEGKESAFSAVASKNVVASAAPKFTVSAPVTVSALPLPPTGVTIDTVAYEYRPATKAFAMVGVVPLGIPCGPETKIAGGITYCRVDRGKVDLVVWPNDRRLKDVWVRVG